MIHVYVTLDKKKISVYSKNGWGRGVCGNGVGDRAAGADKEIRRLTGCKMQNSAYVMLETKEKYTKKQKSTRTMTTKTIKHKTQ